MRLDWKSGMLTLTYRTLVLQCTAAAHESASRLVYTQRSMREQLRPSYPAFISSRSRHVFWKRVINKTAVPHENTGGQCSWPAKKSEGWRTNHWKLPSLIFVIDNTSHKKSLCLSWLSAAPYWMYCLPSMPNVKYVVTIILFEAWMGLKRRSNSIMLDFRCTRLCSVTWRRGGAYYLQGLQRHLDVLEFPQQVEGAVLQTKQQSIITSSICHVV